jgi:flotillin
VLEVLPSIMAEFSKGYAAIGNVSIIGGSGEDGASQVVGADNAIAMRSVFDSVHSATGLDLAGIIQGQAVGRGIGEGVAAATAPAPAKTRVSKPTTPPPPPAEPSPSDE